MQATTTVYLTAGNLPYVHLFTPGPTDCFKPDCLTGCANNGDQLNPTLSKAASDASALTCTYIVKTLSCAWKVHMLSCPRVVPSLSKRCSLAVNVLMLICPGCEDAVSLLSEADLCPGCGHGELTCALSVSMLILICALDGNMERRILRAHQIEPS